MGEIRASVTLENSGDREVVYRGHGVEADVRRTTVEGIVDTGAVSLVIPEEIATELGLRHWGTRTVVYADERREERPVTGVTIEIGNLATQTEAIVGPAGSQGPDRAAGARSARPHRRLQKPDAGAAPSGRASPGHPLSPTPRQRERNRPVGSIPRRVGSNSTSDSRSPDHDAGSVCP